MAMELSKNPTVLVVNDTVFAHGGLLPEHGGAHLAWKCCFLCLPVFHLRHLHGIDPATYGLERVNREVCRWMRGEKNPDGTPVSPPFLAMG